MSSRLVLCCLPGLLAGLGLGWWLRPGTSEPPSAPVRPVTSVTQTKAAADTSSAGEQADPLGLIHAELAAATPSRAQLQLLFMQWFERQPDLWSPFQELEKQYPGRAADLTAAFFTAWAWKDCAAAGQAISGSALKARGTAIIAAWQVACALGDPAGARLEAGIYVKDWSPLERLAGRNPQAALTLVEGLRDISNPPASLLALARGWGARDGAAAAAWAAGLKEGGEGVFREACLAWDRKEPGALRRAGDALRQRIADDAVLSLLSATSRPAGPVYGNPEAVLAARRDPFATMEDVLAEMRRTAAAGGAPATAAFGYPATTGEWSPADPIAALRELLAMPAEAARDRMIGTLLNRWTLDDAESAAAFAKAHGLTMPASPSQIIQSWEKVQGLAFQDAIRVAMPDGQTPDWNALSAAVSRQAGDDPAAATAFLTQHMDEITRGEGSWRMVLGNTLMRWSELDINAAVEWAAALPAGPVRDQAIGGTLQELGEYDPAAALTWMATMKHPNSGSTDLRQVAGDLQQRLGSVGARLALRRSPLPDAVKEELIKTIR